MSYSNVYFSNNGWAGLLFLAATFIAPKEGLVGLSCVFVANLFAYFWGCDRSLIRSGIYGLNALLVGLAVSYYFSLTPELIPLLLATTLMSVLATSALSSLLALFNLPVLSLSFALVTLIVYFAALNFPNLLPAIHDGEKFSLESIVPIPGILKNYLKVLAAVFFRLDSLSGLLVILGLAVASRISLLLSFIGFLAGSYFYYLIGGNPQDANFGLVGFNFALSAIAIGGVFAVPSGLSYLTAILSSIAAALIAAALHAFLLPYKIAVLSLPFIMSVYVLILGLRMRLANRGPELLAVPEASPEENMARAHSHSLRFLHAQNNGVKLPFLGTWKLTQGIEGTPTHQSLWRYALDFSVVDERDKTYSGEIKSLSAFHSYNLPVVAPVSGEVAKIMDGLPDNEAGFMDTEHNWGNYIAIKHDSGYYSLLAHLKSGSMRVRLGDRVEFGQVLAFCGNSGRSPEPHIHYQIQRTAEPGGETIPFSFSHYIRDGEKPILVENALPQEGELVSNLVAVAKRRQALHFIPGRDYEFEVNVNGRHYKEIVQPQVDLYGSSYLSSKLDHKARLYYQLGEDIFTSSYFSGKPGSLLYALFLATVRIPLVKKPELVWSDKLPLSYFLKGFSRITGELILPFLPGTSVAVTLRFLEPADRNSQGFFGVGSQINPPFSRLGAIEAQALFHEESGILSITLKSSTNKFSLEAKRILPAQT